MVVLYFFFVLQTENNSISSTTRNSAIFMSTIVTLYIWYNKCRVRTEFMWDCFVIIQSQLWIIQTAVNFLFCWLLFVCRVNRTKSVIKREQNDSLLLFCWVWTDYVMFMCRQTGNLWFILIQKGREKKGWGNTLRQKGDFLGSFYSSKKKLAIPN